MTESQALERAMRRRITDFEGKAGAMALRFAYHAALPVALDADLLHLLRINFFLDPPELLAYTAEADLLLSSLCTEIRDGLYEIESDVRDYLLAELFAVYGQERIRDIATLLWQYTENYAPWEAHPGLQRAQQLTALNFLEPQQAQEWLNTAEASVIQQGVSLERQWFVAMRQDLQRQQVIREKQHEQNFPARKQVLQSSNILVISDDADSDIPSLLLNVLEETSYKIVTINGSQQSLEVILQLLPVLLVFDYLQPENGLELYDLLQERKETHEVPAIMICNSVSIDALTMRGIHYLRKPIDLGISINLIARVLAEFTEKQRDTSALGGVSPRRLEEMQEALQSRQDLYTLYKMFLQFVEEITHSGSSKFFLLSKDTKGEETLQLIAYFIGSDVVIIDDVDKIILSDWNIGVQSGKPQIIHNSSSESSAAFEESLFTETPDPLERSTRRSELGIPLLNPKTGLMIGVINVQGDFPFSSSVGAQVETLASTCAIVLLRIQEKQVSRLLQESYRLYTQRRFHDAQALYEQLLSIDRNNAQAWQGRGLIQAKNDQHQEALNSFEQALKLEPDNALCWNGLGETLSALNRSEGALQAFDKALRIDPNMSQAQSNRDVLLFGLNPENADFYNNRGLAYCDQQRYEEAIADYDKAIELNPENADFYNNRGNAYYDQQKYEEAIADYSQALNFGYNVYLKRGYSYLRIKNVDRAREDFIKGAEREPGNVNMAWMVIFVSLQKERPGSAVVERLEAIALINLQSAAARTCLGVALGLRGKLREGLAKLDEAFRIYSKPQDASFWKGMLSAYHYQSNPQIAVEAIEKALANGLPPVLLTPLYWIEKDNAQFFTQYAKPLLERYGV